MKRGPLLGGTFFNSRAVKSLDECYIGYLGCKYRKNIKQSKGGDHKQKKIPQKSQIKLPKN